MVMFSSTRKCRYKQCENPELDKNHENYVVINAGIGKAKFYHLECYKEMEQLAPRYMFEES